MGCRLHGHVFMMVRQRLLGMITCIHNLCFEQNYENASPQTLCSKIATRYNTNRAHRIWPVQSSITISYLNLTEHAR